MGRRRFAAVLIAAALVAGLVAPGAVAQEDEEKSPGPIPTGFWVGFADFRGTTDSASIKPEGSFNLEVRDGMVEGAFEWFGIASTSRSGPVSVDIAGVISGPADRLEFTLTSVVANGEAVPGPDFGGGEMVWTLVTCERVEGIPTRIDTQADVSNVRFWAVRTDIGRDPDVFFGQVKALQEQIDDVQAELEAGTLPKEELVFQLDTIMGTAELAATALVRDPECIDDLYQSVLATEFARLLKWALEVVRTGAIQDGVFRTIAHLAARAGLLSPDGEYYNEGLDADLYDYAASRIKDAEGAGDADALLLWMVFTGSMGYEALAEAAATALDALA